MLKQLDICLKIGQISFSRVGKAPWHSRRSAHQSFGVISKVALAERTICASGCSRREQTRWALDCDFSPTRDNEPWHSHKSSSARGSTTQSSIVPMLLHVPVAALRSRIRRALDQVRLQRKLFKNPSCQTEWSKNVSFGFSLQRQKMVFFASNIV